MNEIAREPLDTRYIAPVAPLDEKWLNEAVREVLDRLDAMMPRFSETFPAAAAVDGIYPAVEKVDWTEGFWVGMLWLAYELTGDPKYRKTAEGLLPQFRTRLEQKVKTSTHDLGFLYSLSCVAAWKLTGNAEARSSALWAADLLYERYNRTAGIVQAWGALDDPAKQGRMIIDCNLNLPLLFWATEETGVQWYAEAAKEHLRHAMKYLVRPDASTYHTYFMDVHIGKPLRGTTHQGYSDTSCWARGQAWAIDGFALNTRYMEDPDLLDIAQKTSIYFLNRLPEDCVCYWDLIFKPEGGQPRDTSAVSCAVCGLLEQLKSMTPEDALWQPWHNAVAQMMRSLRENYLTKPGQDGLLLHGVYNYPRGMGIDTQNLWGDYFYLEALVRLKKQWDPYW